MGLLTSEERENPLKRYNENVKGYENSAAVQRFNHRKTMNTVFLIAPHQRCRGKKRTIRLNVKPHLRRSKRRRLVGSPARLQIDVLDILLPTHRFPVHEVLQLLLQSHCGVGFPEEQPKHEEPSGKPEQAARAAGVRRG